MGLHALNICDELQRFAEKKVNKKRMPYQSYESEKSDLRFPFDIQKFAAALELDCEETGVSIEKNTSNVWVTITAKRTSSYTYWDDKKTGTVECDGEKKSFQLSLPSNKTSNSVDVKFSDIKHNDKGSKTVKVSASLATGTASGTISDSMSFKLTDIPRYANITSFNVTNLSGFDGLTKLQVSYSVDSTIDQILYSVDNGTTWHDLPSTWVIEGLQPGTGYNVKIRVKRADSQLTTDSNSIYIATLSQAYITSGAPNITNGQELRVIANNPSGAKCKVYLQVPIGTNRIIKEGNDVTFSAEEINSLMQYITTQTAQVRVYVLTFNDSETEFYNNYINGTYTIVNSEPTFNYFDYEDINEKTLALTGNEKTCVVGYSNIKATIPTANKAIAKNYATMNKYRLTIGQESVEEPYSESSDVILTLNNIKASTFSMFAIDSRGLSSVVSKVPTTVISYNNLIKNNDIVASRVNSSGQTVGASELVKVTFSGQMWKGNFGTKENSIIGLSYRYRATFSNTWSDWLSLNTSLINIDDNGKFTFNNLIKGDTDEGFDENNSYVIELIVKDELSEVSYSTNVGSAIPHLAWHKNGMGIMGKYDVSKGGPLQVQGEPINNIINNLINSSGTINLETLKNYISNGTLINELIGIGTNCLNVSYTNWNTICGEKSGFYMGCGMANSPYENPGWFYVIHISHNSLYAIQIAYPFSDTDVFFIRVKNEGIWGSWTRHQKAKVLFENYSGVDSANINDYWSNFKKAEITVFMANRYHVVTIDVPLHNATVHKIEVNEFGDSVHYKAYIQISTNGIWFSEKKCRNLNSLTWESWNAAKICKVVGYNY